MDLILRTICNRCVEGEVTETRLINGSPVDTITDCDVPTCDTGWRVFELDNKLQLPVGIFWAVEVYEAIDEDEYDNNDLSDKDRGRIDFLLSAGMVDLVEDSKARGTLWQLFDENSATRANLIVLIGE